MAYVSTHSIPAAGAKGRGEGFFSRLLVRLMRAREAQARRQIALYVSPEVAEAILTREPMSANELKDWFAND